jgi:hypothetical protein
MYGILNLSESFYSATLDNGGTAGVFPHAGELSTINDHLSSWRWSPTPLPGHPVVMSAASV